MRSVMRQLGNAVVVAAGATALACAVAPTESSLTSKLDVAMAKGTGTNVTVSIVSTSPGLDPSPDATYPVTIPSGGFMEVRPACSSSDRLNLQGMTGAFEALGTRSTCNGNNGQGFMFLKLLANHTSPAGPCDDQNAPQQTANAWNFGVTSRYFFQVDDGDPDSKFNNGQYTLVLTDCTVEVIGTSRRITASVGDLYAGQTGTPMAGFTNIAVNVDVTIVP